MPNKIFEFHWKSIDEKEWVSAPSLIAAIKVYLRDTASTLDDMDDEDEIRELPETEWPSCTVVNVDYDHTDPEDWSTMTFDEWMKLHTDPQILAGTLYNQM